MSAPIRALIVDDDAGVRFTLSETLQRAGYEVAAAASGEAALDLLRDRPFDLAILDLNLGTRVDGLRVLEGIRWRWPQMAVVILTAHGSLESAMAAIREGVDGYLLKPAEPNELLAAAREALARRLLRAAPSSEPQRPARVLRHGPLLLDLDKRQLECAGRAVDLAPAEFSLLACLIENAHRTVPPKELVRVVQGYEPDYQHEARQIVKWYIHRLRAKIEPAPTHPRFILNVRGVGYTIAPASEE
ncbi:MAG: response regulator transcription factor [Chloroflexi bacterium]|nr:response regulator transcription factor [Chloroflexota bacterium]